MGKRADVELTEVHKSADNAEKSVRERRSSLDQPIAKGRSNLRHTQSQNPQRRLPSIPTIQETSDEETSRSDGVTLSVPNLARKQSTASGVTLKSSVRDSSRSNQSGRSQAGSGSVNRGFLDSAPDGDVVSYQSRYSSNQSLSTQKEQYCCSPNCRFTPRERKLCASVGVLATIIVILVIVVGYLADQKGGETTFRWKF